MLSAQQSLVAVLAILPARAAMLEPPDHGGAVALTISVALACVALSWALLLVAADNRRLATIARLSWTLGFLAYVLHVAFAFHFYHHWSHAAAAWHTGRRTYELTGWFWTGGIWINHFFTMVWAADVLYWWWSGLDGYRWRSAKQRWFVQAFFAFMIIQAGVVFASGPMRWGTLAGLLVVGALGLIRLIRSP